MNGCELCRLERLTRRYWSSEAFVVCDCLTCGTPMVVFREHRPDTMPVFERGTEEACRRLFGKRFRGFRKEARKIRDHCHWHVLLEDE